MKALLVIGLGSMGRRRIRLARTLRSDLTIVGVDLRESRRQQVQEELGLATEVDLETAIRVHKPSAAIVSTSPMSHGPIVMTCLKAGLHVFTEINLQGAWYDEAQALAREKGVSIFLSSTFLYRREIEYIISSVKGEKVDYIYHSGQYLPDWHPWESYKDFFVSKRETNACREILAIEFPWLIKAFGEVENLTVMKDKSSSLDIDFCDNYMISIRHKSGTKGVFCQDVIARKGLRRLEVYSEKTHLFWEGTPQSLARYNPETKIVEPISLYESVEQRGDYNANIIENAYSEELREFFDTLEGHATPRYSLEEDAKVLSLIDGIEGGLYGA